MLMEIKTCGNCKRSFSKEADFLSGTKRWRLCNMNNLWFDCTCGSTLMIPKGKYPWYSPSMGMSTQAGAIFNRISQISSLPHIPSAIMELQVLLVSPDVEMEEIVRSVKKDPFLASEILRIAENLKSTRDMSPSPMGSLKHAIAYVGRKNLSSLVMAAAIRSFSLQTKIFNEDAFWTHSFLTASIAEALAIRLGFAAEGDHIYIAGCLCNLGKLISALCFPDETDQVQLMIDDVKTMSSWAKIEKQFNLPSHCSLGEVGGALWGLPPLVIDAARYHHSEDLPEEYASSDLISIVSLSNLLSHWIMLEPHRIDPYKLNIFAKRLNFSKEDLDQLAKTYSSFRSLIRA